MFIPAWILLTLLALIVIAVGGTALLYWCLNDLYNP